MTLVAALHFQWLALRLRLKALQLMRVAAWAHCHGPLAVSADQMEDLVLRLVQVVLVLKQQHLLSQAIGHDLVPLKARSGQWGLDLVDLMQSLQKSCACALQTPHTHGVWSQ